MFILNQKNKILRKINKRDAEKNFQEAFSLYFDIVFQIISLGSRDRFESVFFLARFLFLSLIFIKKRSYPSD